LLLLFISGPLRLQRLALWLLLVLFLDLLGLGLGFLLFGGAFSLFGLRVRRGWISSGGFLLLFHWHFCGGSFAGFRRLLAHLIFF